MSTYEIKIRQFEGPLDLLLYLVQKHEVNPIDISIASICDQFVAYLDGMEEADLSVAGDFLYMAAHLMSLKARELLPKEEQGEEELLEFDEEREELIRRMMEYQKFKEVADTFKEWEEQNFGTYSRGREESTRVEEKNSSDLDVGVYELYKAFLSTLKSGGVENVHTIEVDYVTIEDRQQAIENRLLTEGRSTFEDLLNRDFHPVMISVTFMALLEMVKLDQVVVRQSSVDSVLRVYRKKNNVDYLDEMSYDVIDESEDPKFTPGLVEMIQSKAPRDDTMDLDVVLRTISQRVADGERLNDKDIDDAITGNVIRMPDFAEFHRQALEDLFKRLREGSQKPGRIYAPKGLVNLYPQRRALKKRCFSGFPKGSKFFH